MGVRIRRVRRDSFESGSGWDCDWDDCSSPSRVLEFAVVVFDEEEKRLEGMGIDSKEKVRCNFSPAPPPFSFSDFSGAAEAMLWEVEISSLFQLRKARP